MTRAELYELLDKIPDEKLETVEHSLRQAILAIEHEKDEQDHRAWLTVSAGAFDFWDNELDSAYDKL